MIARLKVEAVFSSTFPSSNFISEWFRGTHLPDDPKRLDRADKKNQRQQAQDSFTVSISANSF